MDEGERRPAKRKSIKFVRLAMVLEIYAHVIQLSDGYGLQIGSQQMGTVEFFQSRDLHGNGHTWAGVVESIIRLELPGFYDLLQISPEADDLLVTCKDRETLERLEEIVWRYVADEAMMARAIENGDPDWLD